MTIQRVALIYDDTLRPETTGYYCREALRQFVEVEHFRPGDLAAIPRDAFDLYLNIDDGLPYRLPDDLGPSAGAVFMYRRSEGRLKNFKP